jgi:hypothetical protein
VAEFGMAESKVGDLAQHGVAIVVTERIPTGGKGEGRFHAALKNFMKRRATQTRAKACATCKNKKPRRRCFAGAVLKNRK